MVGLGFPSGYQFSGARGANQDGSVVVGVAQNPPGGGNLQAFRWTAGTGMVGLGFLPGYDSSYANATNADGSVVVGFNDLGGATHSARWTTSTGWQSIQDILTTHGVDLFHWTLSDASGLSADGTTIAGNGYDPSGHQQAWVARIPVNAFALLDLAGVDHSIGSMVWNGLVTNSGPNPATLFVGGDNTSTTFDGAIRDGTSPTALVKEGTGALILTDPNTFYTGATTVNGGALLVTAKAVPGRFESVGFPRAYR
jgi:autotransporter-associated beta strand protein/probable HAF family extracellular repeat protein